MFKNALTTWTQTSQTKMVFVLYVRNFLMGVRLRQLGLILETLLITNHSCLIDGATWLDGTSLKLDGSVSKSVSRRLKTLLSGVIVIGNRRRGILADVMA